MGNVGLDMDYQWFLYIKKMPAHSPDYLCKGNVDGYVNKM